MTEIIKTIIKFSQIISDANLGVVFLYESCLPEYVRQVLGGHEASLEVLMENMVAVMFLSPEIVTEVYSHIFN